MTNKGKMIEAIYAACLTKRATLVIFYLINRANQELTCFPSVGTIAKECNMSKRTVQRALNDLEEAGFIERESRFHERGGQRSSLYRINEKIDMQKKVEEVGFETMKNVGKRDIVPQYKNNTEENHEGIIGEGDVTKNKLLHIFNRLLRRVRNIFFI